MFRYVCNGWVLRLQLPTRYTHVVIPVPTDVQAHQKPQCWLWSYTCFVELFFGHRWFQITLVDHTLFKMGDEIFRYGSSISIRCKLSSVTLGLYSLNGRTSCRKISWSREVTRFGSRLFQLLWNLTGTSTALLPGCLSNIGVMPSL